MNTKYVHNFIIVVILSIVASKSEGFGVASRGDINFMNKKGVLSAPLQKSPNNVMKGFLVQ